MNRLRVQVRGAVQGVGFRPFVFRLAREMALAGWVVNDTRGVIIEVEGHRETLERFGERLEDERPAHAFVESTDLEWLEPSGLRGFEIRHSDGRGARTVLVLPDLATCDACLDEVLNPAERRHRYPFANCTNCGPRFTIVRALPYDRPNTSMAGFPLCPACRSEYEAPADRRFHAQPIACSKCGPRIALWSAEGETLATGDDALSAVIAELGRGRIAAIKGLGGFHLVADAADTDALRRLRERKHREAKPLALMVRDVEQARTVCEVGDEAAQWLRSVEAPIVLLPRRAGAGISGEVAPGNPRLGVMLPATPLHHLLMRGFGRPLVATSGNLSDEPICVDEREALTRLSGIADLFLVHDRPIERHVDDSVGTELRGRFRLLRRARGYAPLPVPVGRETPTVLAVGAHMKNTVALSVGRQVVIGQHIGDLETPQAQEAFERVIADLLRLYEAEPVAIAHDLHPDYVSTRRARAMAATDGVSRLIAVQHHHAHLAACLGEHGVEGPALGVVWDGTGYGTDGTVWGGEFLRGDARSFERVAHLRPFRLPGGEAAVREPARVALALLWEIMGEAAFERDDLAAVRAFGTAGRGILARLLARGLNAPVTTSAGRLFDGIAALAGLQLRVSFEGQAAMALEFAAGRADGAWSANGAYRMGLLESDSGCMILDWEPLVWDVLLDVRRGTGPEIIAARFHGALIGAAVEVARVIGMERVALTGGCFQNHLLAARLADALEQGGHRALLHERVPPNDGGISLGQVLVAAATMEDTH